MWDKFLSQQIALCDVYFHMNFSLSIPAKKPTGIVIEYNTF